MGIFSEFKEFAMKGNLVDMAVGFILGGAFATVVKSFVTDVIMPPIGLLLGGTDFSKICLYMATRVSSKTVKSSKTQLTSNLGVFINNAIAFLIVAGVVFFVVKGMNEMMKKREEEEAAPEEPSGAASTRSPAGLKYVTCLKADN